VGSRLGVARPLEDETQTSLFETGVRWPYSDDGEMATPLVAVSLALISSSRRIDDSITRKPGRHTTLKSGGVDMSNSSMKPATDRKGLCYHRKHPLHHFIIGIGNHLMNATGSPSKQSDKQRSAVGDRGVHTEIAEALSRTVSSIVRLRRQNPGTEERRRRWAMTGWTFPISFLLRSTVIAGLVVANSVAQSNQATDSKSPLRVAPQAYKLEFENDWVRVTRVHYGPHEKLPEHYHTERASAYVYLNDSGPVIFKHIDLPYGAITRAPTKSGSFRLFRGVKEVHAVENPTDVPSDFMRIEFKTEPVNESSLRGKYFREPHPAGENYSKVQFENEQIRITRVEIAGHKTMDMSTASSEPALIMALVPARFVVRSANRASQIELTAGKSSWLPASQQALFENSGDSAAEALRFDFKTRPFDDPSDRMRKPSNR
jgi:hypothetical protein